MRVIAAPWMPAAATSRAMPVVKATLPRMPPVPTLDAAKLPDEVQTMTEIQAKIQNYYDLHGGTP